MSQKVDQYGDAVARARNRGGDFIIPLNALELVFKGIMK